MTKSKRFWVLIGSGVIFVVGLYFRLDPIALGTGLTLLTAPYLAAETFRQSV